MNLVKSIVAGVLVLALAVFSLPAAEAATDWDGGRIRAEGTGVAPINTVSAAQARALARRAAIADAYRQLAEQIRGVDVDASTTVENMMVTNDTVRTHVSALVRGARIIEEKALRDGAYTVTLEVPVFGVSSRAPSLPPTQRASAGPALTASTIPIAPATTTRRATAPTTAGTAVMTGIGQRPLRLPDALPRRAPPAAHRPAVQSAATRVSSSTAAAWACAPS